VGWRFRLKNIGIWVLGSIGANLSFKPFSIFPNNRFRALAIYELIEENFMRQFI
jgi:hypothetical protein